MYAYLPRPTSPGMHFLSAAVRGDAQVPQSWPSLQYLWVAACAAQAVWALYKYI